MFARKGYISQRRTFRGNFRVPAHEVRNSVAVSERLALMPTPNAMVGLVAPLHLTSWSIDMMISANVMTKGAGTGVGIMEIET